MGGDIPQGTDIPRSYPPRDASVPLLGNWWNSPWSKFKQECNSEEIARQLTLIEWDMWSSIKPYEFLNLAWTKKDKASRAGNCKSLQIFLFLKK